jgi:hypothetical protein
VQRRRSKRAARFRDTLMNSVVAGRRLVDPEQRVCCADQPSPLDELHRPIAGPRDLILPSPA